MTWRLACVPLFLPTDRPSPGVILVADDDDDDDDHDKLIGGSVLRVLWQLHCRRDVLRHPDPLVNSVLLFRDPLLPVFQSILLRIYRSS